MNDFVAVENTDVLGLACHPVRLSSNLVIDLRAESVKVVSAILLRNERTHL